MNSKFHPRSSALRPRPSIHAFTLIELLVVIAVIAILAALLFTAIPAIGRSRDLAKARAELTQITTAIEAFKAKYGSYPQDNKSTPRNLRNSPLYLELAGMQLIPQSSSLKSLDGSYTVTLAAVQSICNVSGLVNSSTGVQATDDHPAITSFLTDIKPTQLVTNGGVRMLSCSVNDIAWSYNSSDPTNNPGTYDLWVDVGSGNRTNRVANWNK